MAKKSQIKNNSISKKDTGSTSPKSVGNELVLEENSPLIQFDKRSKAYLIFLCIAFMVLVSFKLNYSSIGVWNQLTPAQGVKKNAGIVYGTPKTIRSDEWLSWSPLLASQAANSFEFINQSYGGGKSPLLSNLPVRYWGNIFQPSMWGFFVLDFERGYSFYWLYRLFAMVAGFFLLLMLFTNSNFWLSMIGSIWIWLSAPVQWWSYLPSVYITSLSFSIVCFFYILYNRSIYIVITSTFILICSAYSFICNFYPPYQVPFAYLILVLVIFYFIKSYNREKLLANIPLKAIALSAFVVILALLLGSLYIQLSESIDLMLGTYYPGKRTREVLKVDYLQPFHLFSDYFSWFVSDTNIPAQKFGNICEFSTFLSLYPVVFYHYIRNIIIKKENDILLTGIIVLMIVSLVYELIPIPAIVAKITLFYNSSPYRFNLMNGVANVILTIVFMSKINTTTNDIKKVEAGLFLLGVLVFLGAYCWYSQIFSGGFFKTGQLLFVVVYFGVLYWIMFYNALKNRSYIFGIMVVIFLIPYLKVNPVNAGTQALTKNPLGNIAREIEAKDPGKRWVIFGDFKYSTFFMANGLNVFSGIKYPPELSDFKILDPGGRNDSIYNRMAHINVYPYINPNAPDTTIFILNQADSYTIGIDPCSDKLKKIGVNYVIFAYQPQPAEVRCMDLISNSVLPMYKLR